MKVAICDDEEAIREYIAACISSFFPQIHIEYLENGEDVAAAGFDADILFLDIRMPGIDGMEAARHLRANGKKTVLIFVTALEDYVFSAFDVGAFHYILKPIDRAKLLSVFERAMQQAEERKENRKSLSSQEKDASNRRSITVKSGKTSTNVIVEDIFYAEVFDRRIVLHINGRNAVEYYGRLAELAEILGNDFFRIHRSYLINLGKISTYDAKTVRIADEEIPVARGKYQELVRAYMAYHVRRENF